MLVDTWAWVELFLNSSRGLRVRDIIRGKNLFVSVLTLAELAGWCVRNGKDPQAHLSAVKLNATVLSLDAVLAEQAGRALSVFRKRAPGIGMLDVILYTQAANNQTPLLTGDPHFRNLPGVYFIE